MHTRVTLVSIDKTKGLELMTEVSGKTNMYIYYGQRNTRLMSPEMWLYATKNVCNKACQ